MNIETMALVPIRSLSLEVALVLDNTGSMNSNDKLTELKAAATTFISTIQASTARSGATARISIVPFAKEVNIGSENFAASWIDWAAYSGNRASWPGCLDDRNQPHDVQNDIPVGDPYTWYPASNCNLAKMMPLTSNWSQLNNKVTEMRGTGNTNVTIGLSWGWNMLTPGAPLSTAAPASSALRKYMIVLTDGLNTQNRWTSDPVQINARTQQTCTAIKSSAITVYTVRVMNGDIALLRSCASSADKFFDISSAAQLTPTFRAIADQMIQSFYLGG